MVPPEAGAGEVQPLYCASGRAVGYIATMQLHLGQGPESPAAPQPGPAGTTQPFSDELTRMLLRKRHVLLTGEIDDQVAALVCAQLLVVASERAGGAKVARTLSNLAGL